MRRRVRVTRKQIERISRTATLGGLFLSFLKIGLVGFGGGVAVLAQIRTLTVRKRQWITDSDFAEAVALAQSLPGTSAGNAVTYIGVRLRGWRGATAAMSGFILPSMLIMIGLAIAYKHVHNFAGSERFFHGLNGAVVALILVTAWRMGKNILTRRWQWALAVLSFFAVAVFVPAFAKYSQGWQRDVATWVEGYPKLWVGLRSPLSAFALTQDHRLLRPTQPIGTWWWQGPLGPARTSVGTAPGAMPSPT